MADRVITVPQATQIAQATKRQLTELNVRLEELGGGLTADVKAALLACFNHVAWDDDDPTGQSYINALQTALYPPANLSRITAVYTQPGTIYDTASLDSLRTNLVVTAYYDNSTSEVISNYTLSGTLSEGTSTITAAYGGKTATFTVTVTSTSTDVTIAWTGSGSVFNTGMIDARNADVYFSLPFVDGDSNLVSGATSDTVPVQIRVNVYDSADSTSAYGFYYIDTETKVTTARTWANTPNLPWNTELKIIPAGDFIKVQVNKPNNSPFTSNSACMAYLNAHGTTLKLRATGGA